MSAQTAVSSADEVLRLIEKASEKAFLPIIGPYKGRILAEEVRKAKPRHLLEVGTLIGYSAILMGKELDDKSEIVTIEIHRDEAELAGKNIIRAKILPKIKIITGDALIVIPTLRGQFDFAFIDAEKSEYFQYLKLAEGRLRKGAVVFADNAGVFADQMGDYLNYVRKSGKYQSRYIQVGSDGVEISVKL
ncbi:MAG: class I SAM-dependent methyltransferase [Chloroflexi bacterium]|nr:class I SAM-dependent methyltransferase [Chloroflexota bacterium]MCL5950071.1 class I SAM-dependent methyltransferase [Candidatus Bathyarchaeota archaeon]